MIQQEANEFLSVQQRMFNATVHTVAHSKDGVTITLIDGTTLSAEYALCTFSLGVLQNDDVQFRPTLPRKYHHLPSLLLSSLRLLPSIQARGYPRDGNGHIHENISPIPLQVLVFNRGIHSYITICIEILIISAFRWQSMPTPTVVVTRSGKAWTIQSSSRDQE